MKKKRFFGIFRLGKPRVANLTPGIDSLRNFIDYVFLKFFFYRSKPLVAKNAKKKVFVRVKWQRKVKQT